MSSAVLNRVPYRSITFQVGKPHKTTDLTVTIAQADADKLDGCRITVDPRRNQDDARPYKNPVARFADHKKCHFVFKEGEDLVGLSKQRQQYEAVDNYLIPPYFDSLMTFILTTVGNMKIASAVFDHTTTFSPSEDLARLSDELRTGPAQFDKSHPKRTHKYLVAVMTGINSYIQRCNDGFVDTPLQQITVALDEAAYAVWVKDEMVLKTNFLRFHSAEKRQHKHVQGLLKNTHLNFQNIESWLPNITRNAQSLTDIMQRAIIAHLAHSQRVRRHIENWSEFDDPAFDGNYVHILETRAASMGWVEFVKLFSYHALNAATLLDYAQLFSDAKTAKTIRDRLMSLT